MDALSHALRAIRLTSALFVDARLTAPWAVASPPPQRLGRMLGVRDEGLALIHVVADGGCWVAMGAGSALSVPRGGVVVFPHAHAHTLASAPGIIPIRTDALLPRLTKDAVPRVHFGGAGEPCRLVCGYVRCEHPANPLIGALPAALVASASGDVRTLPNASDMAVVLQAGDASARDRIATLCACVMEELDTAQLRRSVVLPRLVELIYIEILRRYGECASPSAGSWIGAVQDRAVGHALRLLHEEPARAWTVAGLGKSVGLSRSALAQRFHDLTGTSPAHYLATWRVQLSMRMLRDQSLSVAQVASRVGYGSAEAFHRAFRRHMGESPAAWRDGLNRPGRVRDPEPREVGTSVEQ